VDKYTNEIIPRKYFSGGTKGYPADPAMFAQVVKTIYSLDPAQTANVADRFPKKTLLWLAWIRLVPTGDDRQCPYLRDFPRPRILIAGSSGFSIYEAMERFRFNLTQAEKNVNREEIKTAIKAFLVSVSNLLGLNRSLDLDVEAENLARLYDSLTVADVLHQGNRLAKIYTAIDDLPRQDAAMILVRVLVLYL